MDFVTGFYYSIWSEFGTRHLNKEKEGTSIFGFSNPQFLFMNIYLTENSEITNFVWANPQWIRNHLQIIRSKSETERNGFPVFAELQNPFLI
jgi:hypothetical protein